MNPFVYFHYNLLRSNNQECKQLQDRLYRCKDSNVCLQGLGAIPEFPYEYVNVGVAPAVSKYAQPAVTPVRESKVTPSMATPAGITNYENNYSNSYAQQPSIVTSSQYSDGIASNGHYEQAAYSQNTMVRFPYTCSFLDL